VDPVDNGVDLAPLHFGVDSVGKEGIAGFVFEVHNAFFGVTGYLDTLDVFFVDDLLHECSGVGVEVLESRDIDFVDDEKGGFSVEEGFDGVEKFTLFFLDIRLEKTAAGDDRKRTWASTEYPHCSLRSMKYRTQLFR